MYYLRNFYSFDELKTSINSYVNFYNNERLQERFNDMAPMKIRRLSLKLIEESIQYHIKENKIIQKYYAQFNNQITNCETT